MSDNNGHEEKKTEEELKAEKIAKFNENPDSFVCIEDLVIAISKTENGMATWLGPFTRIDFEIALSRLTYNVHKVFQSMDAKATIEKSKIINPGSPIMTPVDFARRKR